MISPRYRKQHQCSACGSRCYALCYVGARLVCVDCFKKACDQAQAAGLEIRRKKEAAGNA